ncbi:PEF-CTERM sorting domain-containing protein [Methanolobus sediminis]|uniref:PEF-CTERM sorting domain-containing protein n=1 Tax=Methanolobus sediminis TaxID=3072978 RepID=A0AA51UMC4_9EURY|nr:PEF-CTERM sorting domain-containing protein [Methanolobus sediminis]WMW26229.1 PEF-CTERM sorting domain-containing protein [Methanolobus sediminis]
MKSKQSVTLYIGLALVFLAMFVGNAIAQPIEVVSLEKYTLGTDGVWYDADVATGPEIPVGSIVKWKYVITNNMPVSEPDGILDTYAPGEMVIAWLNDYSNVSIIYEDENCTIPAFINGLPISPKTIPANESVEFFACGIAVFGQYENFADVAVDIYDPGPTLIGSGYDMDYSHYLGVKDNEIPEFPTIVVPIAAIIGLAFIIQRRKN